MFELETEITELTLGAIYQGNDATHFRVWAPYAEKVEVELVEPHARKVPLNAEPHGYHSGLLHGVGPGSLYWLVQSGNLRLADPASRFQPQGVFGPSEVVEVRDPSKNRWSAPPLTDFVIYELHIGCFTQEGTFSSAISQLDELEELGITAVEIMPAAQFPGKRNWGYDGVFPYAAQNSYGGPAEMAKFVQACHERNLAVLLDVVYNHIGPEGNFLGQHGPYFTDRYHTPWGDALNFDGNQADAVRRYFIENALYWVEQVGVDGLRLDAIQMIFDSSARPFLAELSQVIHAAGERLGRPVYLIGETNQNDVRQVWPVSQGGMGLDAVWNDDFYHSLHATLSGERHGLLMDYGPVEQIAAAFSDGFVKAGQYAKYQQRRHGSSSAELPGEKLVVFAQNHDQIGNRLYGERLGEIVDFEQTKLAAAILLLSPYVPLLFMGEEYGEPAPFLYFIDHQDAALRSRVRQGRLRDCADFLTDKAVPPPGAKATMRMSTLNHELKTGGRHQVLWNFHRRLLELRRQMPPGKLEQEVTLHGEVIRFCRVHEEAQLAGFFNFGKRAEKLRDLLPAGNWQLLLNSAEQQWQGPAANAPPEKSEELTISPASALLLRIPAGNP